MKEAEGWCVFFGFCGFLFCFFLVPRVGKGWVKKVGLGLKRGSALFVHFEGMRKSLFRGKFFLSFFFCWGRGGEKLFLSGLEVKFRVFCFICLDLWFRTTFFWFSLNCAKWQTGCICVKFFGGVEGPTGFSWWCFALCSLFA